MTTPSMARDGDGATAPSTFSAPVAAGRQGRRSMAALASIVMSAIAVLSGGQAPVSAAPAVSAASTVRSRYIVSLEADASPALVTRGRSAEMSDVVGFRHALHGFTAMMTPAAAARLAADPRVADVEPDRPVTIAGLATESPAAVQQNPPWGLDRIDQRALPLSGTYTAPTNGAGVTAYVVDTGILGDHEQFGGRVTAGATAIFDENGSTDCNGHGTHVAGVIGGATYGVAKAVTLVPVRVLKCGGGGSIATVIAGLEWVIADHDQGEPAVANLSLTGSVTPLLDAAVAATVADGVTVVVAAGNDGKDACTTSPANAPEAIAVGASNDSDALAMFSNRGSCVDIVAPGVKILSSWVGSPTATKLMSGTSMASPHVAGAIAQMLSATPRATPAQLTERLLNVSTTGKLSGVAANGTPDRLLYVDPALKAANPSASTGPAADSPVYLLTGNQTPDQSPTMSLGARFAGDTGTCLTSPCPAQFWRMSAPVLASDAVEIEWSAAAATRVCLSSGSNPLSPCDVSDPAPLAAGGTGRVTLAAKAAATKAYIVVQSDTATGRYALHWSGQRHLVGLALRRAAGTLDPVTGVVTVRATLTDGSAVANGTKARLLLVTTSGETFTRRASSVDGRLRFVLALPTTLDRTDVVAQVRIARSNTLLAARSAKVTIPLLTTL